MRLSNKFTYRIWWSDEDGCFIANIPELDVCSAHGASQTEALTNLMKTAESVVEILFEDSDKEDCPICGEGLSVNCDSQDLGKAYLYCPECWLEP